MSSGTRILFYVLSFLIPLAGIIIGAIYYSKPEPDFKHVGKNCLIIALISILLTVVFSLLLYVLILGFAGA